MPMIFFRVAYTMREEKPKGTTLLLVRCLVRQSEKSLWRINFSTSFLGSACRGDVGTRRGFFGPETLMVRGE